MQISFGEKRVQKIFKGNQCVSIGIPKDNLILHLDSIGMVNLCDNRDTFPDLSGNNHHIPLTGFDFNYKNGWLPNSLHFDGKKCYGEYNFSNTNIRSYTLSVSFHIPNDGKFIFTCPCIDEIYSNNGDLTINTSSNISKVRLTNTIKPNTFYNLILAYRDGTLDIYINGVKKRSLTRVTISTNRLLSLGKVGDVYGEFMLHSLQLYSGRLSEDDIKSLCTLESSRYIVYYDKSLALDVRGYNQLIRYGGFVSIRDNSISGNHLRCNKYWMLHPSKTRGLAMNGMNDMAIVGRPLLNGSFTIEFMVSKIKYLFADEVLFIGKYKENEYGIQISFDNNGLIIKLHNPNGTFEYHYTLNYTNKRLNIGVTYDRPTKKLIVYHNGNILKSFNNVVYKHNLDDMSVLFCRKEGQLGFVGNIHSIRIYERALTPDIIQTNYQMDRSIYRY